MNTIRALITTLGIIFIKATLGGSLLCILYPSIHDLFPLAASEGIIPYHLSWWTSVCLVWIINILKGNMFGNFKIENKVVVENEEENEG